MFASSVFKRTRILFRCRYLNPIPHPSLLWGAPREKYTMNNCYSEEEKVPWAGSQGCLVQGSLVKNEFKDLDFWPRWVFLFYVLKSRNTDFCRGSTKPVSQPAVEQWWLKTSPTQDGRLEKKTSPDWPRPPFRKLNQSLCKGQATRWEKSIEEVDIQLVSSKE